MALFEAPPGFGMRLFDDLVAAAEDPFHEDLIVLGAFCIMRGLRRHRRWRLHINNDFNRFRLVYLHGAGGGAPDDDANANDGGAPDDDGNANDGGIFQNMDEVDNHDQHHGINGGAGDQHDGFNGGAPDNDDHANDLAIVVYQPQPFIYNPPPLNEAQPHEDAAPAANEVNNQNHVINGGAPDNDDNANGAAIVVHQVPPMNEAQQHEYAAPADDAFDYGGPDAYDDDLDYGGEAFDHDNINHLVITLQELNLNRNRELDYDADDDSAHSTVAGSKRDFRAHRERQQVRANRNRPRAARDLGRQSGRPQRRAHGGAASVAARSELNQDATRSDPANSRGAFNNENQSILDRLWTLDEQGMMDYSRELDDQGKLDEVLALWRRTEEGDRQRLTELEEHLHRIYPSSDCSTIYNLWLEILTIFGKKPPTMDFKIDELLKELQGKFHIGLVNDTLAHFGEVKLPPFHVEENVNADGFHLVYDAVENLGAESEQLDTNIRKRKQYLDEREAKKRKLFVIEAIRSGGG